MDISIIFEAVKTKIIILTAILFLSACINIIYGQQIDSTRRPALDTSIKKPDSSVSIKKSISKPKRIVVTPKKDTIKKDSSSETISVANADTARALVDTIKTNAPVVKAGWAITDSLLGVNKFINVKDKPVLFIASKRKASGKEFTFYVLCILLFVLGLFKTFYSTYFNNVFRVFFNTSIRQTQLTDQLLQAKLPSFMLNIFFSITAGIYVWLLFKNYHAPKFFNTQWLLPLCIVGISAVYSVKFCILKFIGWMGEMQQAASDYIFVIFLVNKIAGIILVPFVVLLAFAVPQWINYLTTLSLLITALFFLSRYIKTYGLLEYKFPLRPLHFLIYITAIEIVPLLLIYKVVVDYVI